MRSRRYRRRLKLSIAASLLLSFCLVNSSCLNNQTQEAYYGKVVVPRAQEFRWCDGGVPQTFDPAFAAAPPDTDVVRAIFEGLTDYDPRTLAPVPAVAKRWESSDDGRVWTFYLRDDARWSNGEPVTAQDFVRSWRRTVRIGQLSPHTELLTNIVGARASLVSAETPQQGNAVERRRGGKALRPQPEQSFGAEALGDHVLRVQLRHGDTNFPALVAHSVFRPVKLTGEQSLQRLTPAELVSNGAFLLSKTENDRVLLERANEYWGRADVELERVEFVGTSDPEAALAAYRAGRVDAVSNTPFEPLVLKLLTPFKDFRRATYGALTYYSFNVSKTPFDDVRVREALAIAIDRERISRDDLDGATEPARKFLPEAMSESDEPVVDKSGEVDQDTQRARDLLSEAGYPGGKGFPRIRLLINRNDQQRIVAQAVAAMWHSVLNIETDIMMKTWDEYEMLCQAGDYDVVRRGMVMQTTDEFTNIRMLFRHEARAAELPGAKDQTPSDIGNGSEKKEAKANPPIESEAQALSQLRAMPIYFASSFSLVRPYVAGFDANVLDVPSLKKVRIDTNWREPNATSLVKTLTTPR
jgi:ABC-type oligopeptide transport system substrate-binding subunit